MTASTEATKITLRQVYEDYKVNRVLKPKTICNYNGRLNNLSDWMELDVRDISKRMIEQRFREIKSKSTANCTMRVLRSLLFYASQRFEDESGLPIVRSNPVRRLTEIRAWHKDGRRKDLVPKENLQVWMRAVFSTSDSTVRDLLLLLLFTGLRFSEAVNLTWEFVDMKSGVLNFGDSKNGERRIVPLSSYAWNLLKTRQFGAVGLFVFPSPYNPDAPITHNSKPYLMIRKRSGFAWSYHSLRRTFVSIADELDIKTELISELVGHKQSTVTENYTIRSTERLREVSERITEAILVAAGLMESRPKVIAVELR